MDLLVNLGVIKVFKHKPSLLSFVVEIQVYLLLIMITMIPSFGFHYFPNLFWVLFKALVSAYGKSQFSFAYPRQHDLGAVVQTQLILYGFPILGLMEYD
jgi:hypothetical protein